jgi:nicotinate-nucleotide--dimethylbenzimidazole phosphoribosyltransferase
MTSYQDTIASIKPADQHAATEAQAYIDTLIKPPGSLGGLEQIAAKLAGITGATRNQLDRCAVVVMAADNGVYEEGVASAPQWFTRAQAINMTRGICGVSVLSKAAGADVVVVDVGIATPTNTPAILDRNVARSTANMGVGPAMTREQAEQAIEVGIDVATSLYAQGYDILGTGEMGIGNTTSTAAVLVALTGTDVKSAVGRGAGLDDEGLARKIAVVERALEVNHPDAHDPIDVLAKVGGLDIAGLVGCFLAAASARKPIMVDGAISAAAALIAVRLAPDTQDFMFATHRSAEPSYSLISAELGLHPILELGLRLGEGTGCPLALHVLRSACAMVNNMGTFADISFDESILPDIRETDQ